jgi:hypothetical protein
LRAEACADMSTPVVARVEGESLKFGGLYMCKRGEGIMQKY